MATEIIEEYDDLKPFHYLLSLSFNDFKTLTHRSGKNYNDKDRKETYKKMINFCNIVIKSKGTITRVYTHSLKTPKGLGGRLFSGGSIQSMPKEIRGLLMKHTTDVDMKNSHPKILAYICKKNNIPCMYLDYYVNNRNLVLSQFSDKDEGKSTILKQLNTDKIIYGKGINELGKEIVSLQKKIIALDEFKEFEETIDAKEWNKNGSYLNKIMCYYENLILTSARKAIKEYNTNIQMRALMFDGFMPQGNYYDDKELLKHITHHVNNEFEGLNMEWDYKEHDNSIKIPDDFKYDENKKPKSEYDNDDAKVIFEKDKLTHFDSDYFNTFKSNYLIQKKYIEHFICKVIRPEPQYIYLEDEESDIGKKSCIFSEGNILTAFRHLITETKTKDDEIKEVRFTNIWLNDPKIKCYNKLDFIPYNGFIPEQNNTKVFNLFTGYNPKILSKYNEEKEDIILKPFFELGVELCGGVQDHFDYLLKYFSHMIQKPNERIPICFIIKGKQGTGKNVFLNAIGKLIGKEHYITSANPKDFFGDYAEGFYHKLLVNMNECEGKDTFDFEGKIKSFITEDTITINPKNVRPSQIRNMARVFIFTNKPNPIPIDVKSSDRRYTVYQTTDKYLNKKYGTIFWKKLIEHFNKEEFIACLYNYLNKQKIDQFDWLGQRPITEAYKEMCKLYVPVEALFLENYLIKYRGCLIKPDSDSDDEETDNESITSKMEIQQNPLTKEIYEEYTKYCKTHGFTSDRTFQPSISRFLNKCNELELPHTIVKSQGYNEFRFTPKEVYDFLVKKKWINRDIDDDEIIIEDVKGEDVEFEI